jgi:hypothetical protein
MGVFSQLSEVIANNKDFLLNGTFWTLLFGGISYIFVKYVLPKFMNLGLLYLSKIMAKLFGQDVEGVSETVNKLPFVDKIKSMEHELHVQNELKLIELKNKIVSPKLSDSERIAYQAMYDTIIRQLGDSISAATIMALEAIENAAKKKLL